MTKIRISCPECQAHYQVDESHVGRRTRCKKCGAVFVISPSEVASGAPGVATPLSTGPPEGGARGILLRAQEKPGEMVGERYRIVELLGEGGMGISDAVLAPRFDCQGDLIKCQARIPEYVCAEVRKKHPIERLPQSHGGFGLVHAIAIDPETGVLSGAADTGGGGMALEV